MEKVGQRIDEDHRGSTAPPTVFGSKARQIAQPLRMEADGLEVLAETLLDQDLRIAMVASR